MFWPAPSALKRQAAALTQNFIFSGMNWFALFHYDHVSRYECQEDQFHQH